MSANPSNTELPLQGVVAPAPGLPRLPEGLGADDAKRMYEGMVLIRAFDERQKKLQRSGRIGFCVTSTGEEAVQVGTAHALEPNDWVFPYYRQYGIMLYRQVPLDVLTNHLFGNREDLAIGRQMPAHYTHRESRFVSSSSVIGTHMIQAVGAAMAAQYRRDPCVVATYIGDGGTSSNDFHSSLTFAGVFKPPVVFFIVNNQYAISLPVSRQCAAESLHVKGAGYGVPAVRVDGNDVFAVYQASRDAYARARAGEGPTLVELLTYRAGPHSSSDDPTRYRGNEAERWLCDDKDPLARARCILQALNIWSEAYEERVWDDARTRINQAVARAESIPEPEWSTLFDDVYAEIPPALLRQRHDLLENERGFERRHEGEFPL